jgi:hypothetical protein
MQKMKKTFIQMKRRGIPIRALEEDLVSHKIMGTLRTTLGIMGTEARELWEL